MKRMLTVLAILLVLPVAASADEEADGVDCGPIENRNSSWQFGQYNWLEFIVETRRAVTSCPLWVAVDAWVVGVPGSAVSRSDYYTASARRQVPVPEYGVYQTNGRHWRVWFNSVWYDNGSTASLAFVRSPARRSNPEYSCYEMGGEWDGESCQLANSPILIDTARNGYRLTSVADGVRFDLDADGSPELVAWTEPDSDDAWLAMDRNGNGRIDDGSELFGNQTRAYAHLADPQAANGFEALIFAQGPSYGVSRADGQVDAADAIFPRLLLWRDRNHNGISEPEELEPAAGAGLVAISTDYKTAKRVDRYGNEFRQRAKALWADGESAYVYDVWLKHRP